MLLKEWRDARWKLALGVLAFVILIPATRSYEAIKRDVAFEIRMTQADMQSLPETVGPMGERERERYLADMRESVREMRSPEYVQDMARWELRDISTFRNVLVVTLLAGLFGIGLIAGEVGRGSIFLLLSRPVSRSRMILTKYSVCAACLFVVAAFGGASVILAAYARGFPSVTVEVERILTSTVLVWLGSLFVLGVALIASVIFRDVARTLVATVAAMFVILAGPDLLRAFVEWLVWGDRIYAMDFRDYPRWYTTFDYFRLYDYWTGLQPYSSELIVGRSLVVCIITAVAALLTALWLFSRKAY